MKIKFLIVVLMSSMCASCYYEPVTPGDTSKIALLIDNITDGMPVSVLLSDIPHWPWQMSYAEADDGDSAGLQNYLKLLSQEFKKYPQDFIDNAGLEGLAVVKNLNSNGQVRSGMPDVDNNLLFLDFTAGAFNHIYQRHVMHHEFYHLIEDQINGSSYFKDTSWAALNESSFKYGNGGDSAQNNSNAYSFTHPQKGFVNQYSTSGLEEDKAEIFASLFIPDEYEKMMQWAQTDDVLRKKIDYMKTFIRQQCSEMNEDFWNNLQPIQ